MIATHAARCPMLCFEAPSGFGVFGGYAHEKTDGNDSNVTGVRQGKGLFGICP